MCLCLPSSINGTDTSWELNRYSTRHTSPVSADLQLRLLSGWGLQKRRSMLPYGPLWLGKDLSFSFISSNPVMLTVLVVWFSGNGIGRSNEVTVRCWDRLIQRWLTICKYTMLAFNDPSRQTQSGHSTGIPGCPPCVGRLSTAVVAPITREEL